MVSVSEGVLFGTYLLILVLVAVLPMYAVFRAPYRVNKLHRTIVMELMRKGDVDKAADLLKSVTGQGSLNRNSTRVTIATVLFVLLFIMTFHLLFFGAPANLDGQVLTTVLAMVASLLSAVVGFYFGGKATESALDKAPMPDLSTIDPESYVEGLLRRTDAKEAAGRLIERAKKAQDRLQKL